MNQQKPITMKSPYVPLPRKIWKLSQLKERMENGTYQVDANKIAEKILWYKGAESNE